jgi:hypothetical protein
VGVNWGRVANDLPTPSAVVQLLKQHGIAQVKLYDTEPTVLRALANSGVKVVVALPNEQLAAAAKRPSYALAWVRRNVAAYYPSTQIQAIAVGNEVFATAPNATVSIAAASPTRTLRRMITTSPSHRRAQLLIAHVERRVGGVENHRLEVAGRDRVLDALAVVGDDCVKTCAYVASTTSVAPSPAIGVPVSACATPPGPPTANTVATAGMPAAIRLALRMIVLGVRRAKIGESEPRS